MRRTRPRAHCRTCSAQQEVAEKLKIGLAQMRDKLGQLTAKRNELVARAKTAQAQTQVQDAIKSIDVMDPTSEIGRFEDKIRREEARVRGQAELAASSLDAQFESLDDLSEQAEVEARLAALKAGSGGGSAAVSGRRRRRHSERAVRRRRIRVRARAATAPPARTVIVTYSGTEMPTPPRVSAP